MGNIVAESSLNGRAAWSVKLDQLPDQLVSLLGTSLRFEGGRPAARSAPRSVTSRQESVQDVTIDLMENALPVPGEFGPGDNEEEELDLCWREGEVTVDVRSASPAEAYRGHCILHLSAKEFAFAAQYFLHFIPEAHIQEVVLPAINEHAASISALSKPITYAEYLIWIALFVIMTAVRVEDHDIYWHRGEPSFRHLWANTSLQERKEFKPDYALFVNGLSKRFVVLVAEFKHPESKQRMESDMVKIGKEMRAMLNRLVKLGIKDPIVCGVLVNKNYMSTYKMDLPSPRLYRTVQLSSLALFKSATDLPLLPTIVSRLQQLKVC
ncbi:hypothetical protein VTP01DRAFT_6700 [Rhizomucor pusillus]|uniref:uncharacterized protein n=1 Tax=Rhizomucor pusillus TaxID=4840 RepID=UPI0037431016